MEKKVDIHFCDIFLVCIFFLVSSVNVGLVSSVYNINSIFSIFPMNQRKPGVITKSYGGLSMHCIIQGINMWFIWTSSHLQTAEERLTLNSLIRNKTVFSKIGNVFMVTKANMVTYRGPTMMANTLHAAAIFSRGINWDWFINLSASDYPLILKMNLNFIEQTSELGWKREKRAMPLIIDPGLYMSTKSEVQRTIMCIRSSSKISWDGIIYPEFFSCRMIRSNAAFARKFKQNDRVLDKIDVDLLGRVKVSFTPGGWCSGKPQCSEVGDIDKLKPLQELEGLAVS
ncbi:Proton pump interactor 1 isoform 1 [Hibiscus syriacus]|uniref:Proton pump interactor 1 isoform 1 n=1 Tax=Hibiscus syriacus TaxID=106335 RepID=A0A6A2YNY6_HIBSY|nr:Proton pump interactor 1 isoform 1 [Hibiscus syriacus]